MPPPIVPAPMTAAFDQRTQRRRLGNVGDLAGRALREERMTQRLATRAVCMSSTNSRRSMTQAFVERLRGRLDAFDAAQRRRASGTCLHGVARELAQRLEVGLDERELATRAAAADYPASRLARPARPRRSRSPSTTRSNSAVLASVARRHRLAAQDHVERGRRRRPAAAAAGCRPRPAAGRASPRAGRAARRRARHDSGSRARARGRRRGTGRRSPRLRASRSLRPAAMTSRSWAPRAPREYRTRGCPRRPRTGCPRSRARLPAHRRPCAARSSASSNAERTACEMLFTGGFEIVMTAAAPSRA